MSRFVSSPRVARLRVPTGESITSVDVLRALKEHQDNIVGAQASFQGACIDIVCSDEDTATLLAARGVDINGQHVAIDVARPKTTHVSVFVPIAMPDSDLLVLMARYGKASSLRRLRFKERDLETFENGVRVVEYETITTPIPSRVSYAGISIGFKYTGQPKSCIRCSSLDHLVKACPVARKPRKNTTDDQTPSPPAVKEQQQIQDGAAENDSQTPSPPAGKEQQQTQDGAAENTAAENTDPHQTTPEASTIAWVNNEATVEEPAGSYSEPLPRERKRVASSPLKTNADPMDTFIACILNREDNSLFSTVALDTVTTARAHVLQLEHGNFSDCKVQSLNIAGDKLLCRTWQSLEDSEAETMKEEIRSIYKKHFHKVLKQAHKAKKKLSLAGK